MFKVILNCWALFLGIGLICLANGLQGTLLGLRARIEGFDLTTTGMVMSGFFIGLMAGSALVPKIVMRVGHVRTFGALASLASTAILIYIVFVDPYIWWGMRFLTGFAYAGLYIVAESWLNEASDNKTRGKLFSFYMLVVLGGMSGGQLMLNIAPPSGVELFVLTSVLISISVIPILLSVSKSPVFEEQESVSLWQLYKVSPLGVVGIYLSGVAMGALFGLGSVYGELKGLSVQEISFFMGSFILGGFLFQYPLGQLSDIIGRRKVIIIASFLGAVASFFVAYSSDTGWEFYLMSGIVGGVVMPIYSLCNAHTNDYLTPQQMVAAGGALLLSNALGAATGGPLTALIMDHLGTTGFFQTIGFSISFIGIFAFWRSTQREAVSTEESGDFVMMPPTPTYAAVNPDLEWSDIEEAAEFDAEAVHESFEELVNDLENN